MFPDFVELLRALNDEGVRYLIVGGYAVSLHAQPRATKDIDLLVECSEANGSALYRALAAFGAPLDGLQPSDFAEPGSFFRMGAPPLMVDILPGIAGVEFDAAWPRRLDTVVDAATGTTAPFISIDDLIASKVAAGRMQDLADVAALRAARAAGAGLE